MKRDELISCFQDTQRISNGTMLRDATERARKSNRVYREVFEAEEVKFCNRTKIIVEENTTFAAAAKYKSFGKTAVLNFANPVNPGGGVVNGAMAQEECLCRSSNLYPCLTDANVFEDYYGYHRRRNDYLSTDRLIYTSNVTVFKTDDALPQMMDREKWFAVDVITCAAPYTANLRIGEEELKRVFRNRVKNIFEAAIDNDVEVLILGAFGCGAFKNPPDIVARAFYEVIQEYEYHTIFKMIVFAIKSTVKGNQTGMCPNIRAFNWCFKKKFSILGDSISTLEGYNPHGYRVFHEGQTCQRTGVSRIKNTWWGKVIHALDGELLVNNSWSGSRVTKVPGQRGLFPSGCSDERTGGLHTNNVNPDVILVYLGTNDWAFGADPEEFEAAYNLMLQKLRANYAKSEIWCCTLCETKMSANPAFKFPRAYGGTDIGIFNEIIRKKAERYRCGLIDFAKFHLPYDSVDGTHPNADGMRMLAEMARTELL